MSNKISIEIMLPCGNNAGMQNYNVRSTCSLISGAALAIATMSPAVSSAGEVDATWIGFGDTLNWGDATNWSTDPFFPNNTADTTYNVTIPAESFFTLPLDRDIEIDQLSVGPSRSNGRLTGSGSLVVNEYFAADAVNFNTTGSIESRGEGRISGSDISIVTSRIVNLGRLVLDVGGLTIGSGGAERYAG